MNGEIVGKATVTKEGLYYRIVCVCDLPMDRIYRIIAVTEAEKVNLGICIPNNSGFELEMKVPIRRMGNNTPKFYAVSKNEQAYDFFEVTQGLPFENVELIRECCFADIAGKKGLIRSHRL